MVETFKKTILFDLDGVLNIYDGKYDKKKSLHKRNITKIIYFS